MLPQIKPALKKYTEHKHYIKKVATQLQKDFEMAGVVFYEPEIEPKTFNALVELMNIHLDPLLKEQGHELKNLLYRADVSEAELHRLLSANPEMELNTLLKIKLLEREFQKVILREQMSG